MADLGDHEAMLRLELQKRVDFQSIERWAKQNKILNHPQVKDKLSAIEADYGLESHNKAAVINQLGLYVQNGMQPPRFFRFHTYADDYSGTISSVDSAV